MITKKTAYQNMKDFESHPPVTTMVEVNEILEVSSFLGHPAVSFYIPTKSLDKFKTSLRKRGFGVEYVVFKSMPDAIYFTVIWGVADFNIVEREIQEK